MTYTKQTWTNAPAAVTPISAARLGVIEAGIEAAHINAETAQATADAVSDAVSSLQVNKADNDDLPATVRVKLAANVSLASTSMASLTGLKVHADANTEHDVSMMLAMTGDAAADALIDVTGPSGATLMLAVQSLASGTGAVSGGHRTDVITALSTAAAAIGLIDVSTPTVVLVNGWVRAGSIPGDFQVRWRQAVASATPNVCKAGSTLVAVRVL